MPYTKQNWNNGSGGGTPLNAARLNTMEKGIEDAHIEKVDKLETRNEPATAVSRRINLRHTLDVGNPNLEEVWLGPSASAVLRRWVNEWGALRGRNPYPTYADALVRAIIDTGDFVGNGTAANSGNAFEIVNRTLPDVGQRRQVWGRRWFDGALIRNGNLMADVKVLEPGEGMPETLPTGSVILRRSNDTVV